MGRHLSRIALTTALAALLVAVAASPVSAARIFPGAGIGPATLDLERAVLEATAGPGVVIARSPDPARPRTRNLDRVVVAYARARITVAFPTDEASTGATRITTRSPVHRLSSGAGVGTRRAALRAAHPRVTCAGTVCLLRRADSGTAATRFTLAGGRVVRVEVLRLPARL